MGFAVEHRMKLKCRMTGKTWVVTGRSGSKWKMHLFPVGKVTHTMAPVVIQKHFEPVA
jgi:hypothetical protein